MSPLYRVLLTSEAQVTLETAYRWMEERNPSGAKAWANGFLKAIESLSTLPKRCALAPETVFFDQEIRQLLYGQRNQQFRALFCIEGDVVTVLFIRHSAQDWIQPETEAAD
ncbi:MAG TPA: type II toxin-antitoxin system RelE/ParE family toxin [Abditibacterium sp.]|jgi:plasmid stabilization system protein ParE